MTRIITISREFGSGGRELGKRLAELLGYDYYDREIITAIAEKQKLDEGYVERTLAKSYTWQTMPLTFRRSFFTPSAVQNNQTNLLLEQKQVIECIAKAGRNCVIVGRNADVLLEGEQPFSIFVCASLEAKIKRCMKNSEDGENLSPKEIEQKIRCIDKNRSKTRSIITGSKWGERTAYHLTINTTDWNIKELTPAVADFAVRWFGRLL